MTEPARQIEFSEGFLHAVHLVDEYYQKLNPTRGQRFVRKLFGLLYNVVIPFPRAQPRFPPLADHFPGREFRKAVFQRQYLAVYELTPDKIRFVLFRHSSLDPDGGFDELIAALG